MMDDVIICDSLSDGDIMAERDPLAYNEDLDVKDEPFEFFDDPSCWASVGTSDNNDDEEFPGLEILSVDDIAQDDGEDSNHLELIEMIEVGGPDVSSSLDDVTFDEELPAPKSTETSPKEMQISREVSMNLDKEKLTELVKREASILKTRQRREKEMVQKNELQRQLEIHKKNVKRLQKELHDERKKMQVIQNQLINLRRRVRRQELKIKKVGEGDLTALDTSKGSSKEEWKTGGESSPASAEETKDPPKGKKKKALVPAKNFKGKRKAEEIVPAKVTKSKSKKKVNESVSKLQQKKIESKPKKKQGMVDVLKLAGFKGKLKVSVAGLAMKRKAPANENPETKKMAKESVVKKAASLKDSKKMLAVDHVKGTVVHKQENEYKKQESKEVAKGQIKRDQKMGEVEQQKMFKVKQEDNKNGLSADNVQYTSELLWNVMSRKKLQPYTTSASKKKTTEVYPNHYFQRQSLRETTIVELPKLVQKFMRREDVSKVGSESSEKHFRMHYLSILHKQFESEYGNVCNFKTFSDFVPNDVVKPHPNHWKTCICFVCINPDFKFEKLKSLGLINEEQHELADILLDSERESSFKTQLDGLQDSKEVLTYCVWERNSSGTLNSRPRNVSEPVAIVVSKLQEELSLLKSHMQKAFCQFNSAKAARERALEGYDEVTFHLDSSPLSIYPHPGQDNGVTDPSAILTALSGYVWSRGGGQKVIVLSDSKDYTFAGVWAGIEKTLLKMVEAGKKKINIISDSPTNKYRNKSTFYYMSDFARTHGVCLRWVFLELCHGIGNAGIIRSELENVIRHQISENPDVPIKCAAELVNLIKPHSAAVIHTYTEKDVQRYKHMQPKLRVIHGTQKIVEVIAFPGDVWARDTVGSDDFRKISF